MNIQKEIEAVADRVRSLNLQISSLSTKRNKLYQYHKSLERRRLGNAPTILEISQMRAKAEVDDELPPL